MRSAAPASMMPRLDYLDGLRGLAALYVVLYHAVSIVIWRPDSGYLPHHAGLPTLLYDMVRWLKFGPLSVDVFIVLSGYCLMMPVARAADGRLRGGAYGYLRRRARRILPPYYAALALSLGLAALLAGTVHIASAQGAITPAGIFSHLLLVHNLRPAWLYQINGPMWSVATEWQIYFLFPGLLIVWRRFGTIALIGVALALGIIPNFLLHGLLNCARPWYIGLFGLGMAAAIVNLRNCTHEQAIAQRLPWGMVTAGVFALLVVVLQAPALLPGHRLWQSVWSVDVLAGLSTAALLVCCTRRLNISSSNSDDGRWHGAALLGARPVVALGAFSYSLYLTHVPVFEVAQWLTPRFALSPAAHLLLLLFIAVPVAVAFAYLFHRIFERPFMPGHPRTERQAEISAVVSPAP